MKLKQIVSSYGYPFLATVSTASLFSIALSLLPIANISEIQKDCIDRTIAFDGLPDKVWSCNGGGH